MRRLSVLALAGLLAGCASIEGSCTLAVDADGETRGGTFACQTGGRAIVLTPFRPLLVVEVKQQ